MHNIHIELALRYLFCQTVYPQFLQSVADTGRGLLAQRFRFGERGFFYSHSGPAAWNILESSIRPLRHNTDTCTLRKRPINVLFDRALLLHCCRSRRPLVLTSTCRISYSGVLQKCKLIWTLCVERGSTRLGIVNDLDASSNVCLLKFADDTKLYRVVARG